MPRFRLNVTITHKGTVLNHSASQAAAKRMVIQLNDNLAQVAYDRVQTRLQRVLRNPTGFYQSRIQVERREVYRGVWDQNVSYGGWLEGVDSRNKTTRFKGYNTFRLVAQSMNQDKEKLAQPAVDRFVQEMNR